MPTAAAAALHSRKSRPQPLPDLPGVVQGPAGAQRRLLVVLRGVLVGPRPQLVGLPLELRLAVGQEVLDDLVLVPRHGMTPWWRTSIPCGDRLTNWGREPRGPSTGGRAA